MTTRNIAFLVGVDQFSDTAFRPLRFCRKDLDGMRRALTNPEIVNFNVVEHPNKRHDEILQSLERTVNGLLPGDKLLFYFAGHGRRAPQTGRLYLVATDTQSDALRSTGIAIDAVLDIIRESRCTNRALVLDCCHSGAIGEEFRGGDIASGLSDLAARNSGTYILTASTAIQLAEERETVGTDGETGNGIFTKYFIEALETGAVEYGDSDNITIDAVYDYIQRRISSEASQQPQRFVIGGTGQFVFGRSSAAQWERRRTVLIAKFRDLQHQNIISDEQYIAAVKVIRASWPSLTSAERAVANAALNLLEGRLSVTEFYLQLETPNREPTPPIRPQPPPERPPHADSISNEASLKEMPSTLTRAAVWAAGPILFNLVYAIAIGRPFPFVPYQNLLWWILLGLFIVGGVIAAKISYLGWLKTSVITVVTVTIAQYLMQVLWAFSSPSSGVWYLPSGETLLFDAVRPVAGNILLFGLLKWRKTKLQSIDVRSEEAV